MSLSVEPGWLLLTSVPVGQLYDVEHRRQTRLTVHNGTDKPRRYRLRADAPNQVGVTVLKGYTGIPDPAWFWFATNEVSAPAHGAADVDMFLRIPDAAAYYNQKWAVGIEIESKPEAGEGLVLAVSPVFYIETEARADATEKPAGVLGLAPAILEMDLAAAGKGTTSATLTVYNNDDRPHSYQIASLVPSAEPGRQVIGATPGFSWIPKAEWLRPSLSAVKIGAHEQGTLTCQVQIPEQADRPGRHLEGLMVIEPDEGPAGFVRVQIRTLK